MRTQRIDHVTEYRFPVDVTLLPHRLLLRPRENHTQRVVSSSLTISVPHQIRWQRDVLDNSVAIASFSAPARSLRIASQVVLEHYDDTPLDFLVEQYAAFHPFAYGIDEFSELAPLVTMAWPDDRPLIVSWLNSLGLGTQRVETFALLDQINRAISRDFRYQAREEPGVQRPAVTLAQRSGSCRDFAALFIEACRHLMLACRFVSGYHTSYASEVGPGSTHAWAEVYLPGPGWKGFDPTAGLVTGSEHIAVAFARHPEAVPPVAGSYLGPATPKATMDVSVHVVPVS